MTRKFETINDLCTGLEETEDLSKKNDAILKKDVLPYVRAVGCSAIIAAIGAFFGGCATLIDVSFRVYDRFHEKNPQHQIVSQPTNQETDPKGENKNAEDKTQDNILESRNNCQ